MPAHKILYIFGYTFSFHSFFNRCLDILNNHLSEKPMTHPSGDTLHLLVTQIKHIERTYTPAVVVSVLPVVHAIFPPTHIFAPPLSGPVSGSVVIGVSTLFENSVGSKSKIYCLSKRYTAYNESVYREGCKRL